MFILSAFADEISPDPQQQIDVLTQCGVRHIELRSILKTNVLDLTDLQVGEFWRFLLIEFVPAWIVLCSSPATTSTSSGLKIRTRFGGCLSTFRPTTQKSSSSITWKVVRTGKSARSWASRKTRSARP